MEAGGSGRVLGVKRSGYTVWVCSRTGIPGYPLLNLYHDYAVGTCAHFWDLHVYGGKVTF